MSFLPIYLQFTVGFYENLLTLIYVKLSPYFPRYSD